MPRIEYRRRDLIVTIDPTQIRVSFENARVVLSAASNPAQIADAVAASPPWKKWAAVPPSDSKPILSRICLDVRGLERASEPWEENLVDRARQGVPDAMVVRLSPVRPRCANFLFGTPLRILRVNRAPGRQLFPALEHQHRGKPLAEYEQAFVTADGDWPSWSAAAMPSGWPNIDVLHMEHLPPLAAHAMSTDAARPGTLGWFVAHLVQWQVRLVVLQTSGGSKALGTARRFAAALVARGGPAIVVEAFSASQRPAFYRAFYRELIHDRPVDWMWREAWKAIGYPTQGTLFVGASREEQLRISRLARQVPAAPAPLKTSLPTRYAPAKKTAKKAPARKTQTAIRKKAATPKTRLPLLLLPVPGAGMISFVRSLGPTAADLLNFNRESTFIKVSKHISNLRKMLPPTITLEDALRPSHAKRAPRFCNISFWRESANGRLAFIDQTRGSFQAGTVCHLAVQLGPKDVRIITANERAFVPELIKWTPEMKGVWIEIGITGIDFDVVGDPVQRLWLPREGPSEAVYFAVVARQEGIRRLRLALYYEQNVIQSFRVAAVVGPKGKGSGADLASALDLAPKKPPRLAWLPVLEFSLSRSLESFAAGDDVYPEPRALSIVANDWNGQSIITVKGASTFGVNVSDRLPLQVKDLRELLTSISGLDGDYPFDGASNAGEHERLENMLRSLADQGSKLFAELINASSWKELRDSLANPDQVIQVAQVIREKVIPWPLIYGRRLMPREGDRDKTGKLVNTPVCLVGLPDENGNLTVKECGTSPQCLQKANGLAPQNVICPMHFWGYRHVIEIPPQQVPAQSKMPDQASGVRTEISVDGKARLVAGLNATFDSQAGHMEKIGKIKGIIPFAPEPEFRSAGLLKRLASSPVHVAYFFCHASGGKGNSDSILILQAPGEGQQEERIPWQDFAQLLDGETWQPPALVFLNGCRTAAYSPEALSPFLRAFVDQLGASGLIGTEISVWDVFAAEMAERFLQEFFNCEPAGPALLKARRAMLAKYNPLGLVYTLFAWSRLKLVAVHQDQRL